MKYAEKIVAFIDILGFKYLVNDESKSDDIGAILKLPYFMSQDGITKVMRLKGVMVTSIFLALNCFRYANQQTLELCCSKLEKMEISDLRAQQKINWMKTIVDRKIKDRTLIN